MAYAAGCLASRLHCSEFMKSFLAACGITDSLRLVIEAESAGAGELRVLSQPFAIIGRDPRADVILDHPQVSRRHVYVQIVEGHAFWVDLESRSVRPFGWPVAKVRLVEPRPPTEYRAVLDPTRSWGQPDRPGPASG